ncbi:MAG: hypothetical protein LBL90_03960 [Prevotellaceae bacterium]|jgi:hypothetical protein|nr:hypothetical protein [Prevotellaceae bacterium]
MYAISLTIEFRYLFTDAYYYLSLGSSFNDDYIKDLISAERKYQWPNYLYAILIILIPSVLVSFCLYVGIILKGLKTSFSKVLDISFKSQIIFALNYFICTLLKVFNLIQKDYQNINNNYDFQSLLVFLKNKQLPDWLVYPLEKINTSELIFVLFLSFGFSFITKQSYKTSIIFVFICYGIGLFIWVIFTLFLRTLI